MPSTRVGAGSPRTLTATNARCAVGLDTQSAAATSLGAHRQVIRERAGIPVMVSAKLTGHSTALSATPVCREAIHPYLLG